MVAPSDTCRSIWDCRWMGPVRYLPAGTTMRPPPAAEHAATALAKASVQSVVPSPTAPKWVRLKCRSGISGDRIERLQAEKENLSSGPLQRELEELEAALRVAETLQAHQPAQERLVAVKKKKKAEE